MGAPAEITTLDDPAAAAADRLAAAVDAGGHIALAGGSTPRAAYERLATMDVDWAACTLWFGDERCVGPDDERSNFGMVRAALLDRLQGRRPDVRRIAGELGPEAAADDYERELREVFGAGLPRFDLILLGLGPDAHCASLFPGQPSLDERERLALGIERPGLAPWVPRVTLTLPVINGARDVVFLATGHDKAAAVARTFAGEPDRDAPASLVAPASGVLTVLIDPPAGERLPADVAR
ncbi:MAG TPA: 6-phosphogluconolactonase [Solirubrobacteraceae bacterium]|nr:6-phosphogluconolactonase [Solirubrobacteraceae bacterium]